MKLRIHSKAAKFRRAGMTFGKTAVDIDASDLNEEQLEALANEPMLVVVELSKDAAEPEMSSVSTLIGSSSLPAVIQIVDKINLQLGELVTFAQQQSQLDEPSWNGLEEEERDVLLASSLDLLKATATAAFEKKGKPNVDKVEEAMNSLGNPAVLSAADRDAAFAVFKDVDFKS